MPGIGLGSAENTGGKDTAPPLLGLLISEDSTYNKIWPKKKRNVGLWEGFLGRKRLRSWILKDDNRWCPWVQTAPRPFTSCATETSYLPSLPPFPYL